MTGIPQTFSGKKLVHSWIYRAKDGAPFGVVGRYEKPGEKKVVMPFFKRNGSGWTTGAPQEPRPLFGLDCLAKHPREEAVFIVEGEKSAAALQGIGICALTSLGGSGAANKANWTPLSGFKTVILWPDNDEPGDKYARAVYRCLMALEQSPEVKLLKPEGLPPGGDCVDWLQNFEPDWDGFQPFPEDSKSWALSELMDLAEKTAKPVPDDSFVGFVGSGAVVFDKKIPAEIKSKLPPVQALETDLIPESYRPWLADVSQRMQTLPDFVTISALVVTGSVIGSGCSIKPKQKDGWEVVPNIWGACIARPSVALKTPCMKEAMRPLDKLQEKYGELYEKEKAGAEFDNLANESMLKDVKDRLSKAAKGKGKDGVVKADDMSALKAQYMELKEADDDAPKRRLFKTNEVTIQAMTILQDDNPRGILVFRDELMGLLTKWDRVDYADERAYFLEGWNGDGSYTDVKIGRGLTEAKNICISLLGGIQPDKLSRYLWQAAKGDNDGLVQRLQLAVWPDEPEHWQNVDEYPDDEARQRAYAILETLAEMDFTQYGAEQGEHDDRPYYRFSEAGQQVFNDWLENLQNVKIKQEGKLLMVEHFGKFRSLMPSLALIFHLIDIADGKPVGNVSEQAARLAVKWCDYLESHARRIYAMADSPESIAAAELAGKIEDSKLPNPFTVRHVIRKGWQELKDKEIVQAACKILIDENWLCMSRKPKPTTGRPPAPEYHINPAVFSN